MAEGENRGGLAAGLAYAAAAFANTPFPIYLGLAVIFLATRWDGHFHDRKGCVQLQEVAGAVYKVDTCTGKTEAVTAPSGVAKAKSAASAAEASDKPGAK